MISRSPLVTPLPSAVLCAWGCSVVFVGSVRRTFFFVDPVGLAVLELCQFLLYLGWVGFAIFVHACSGF